MDDYYLRWQLDSIKIRPIAQRMKKLKLQIMLISEFKKNGQQGMTLIKYFGVGQRFYDKSIVVMGTGVT